MRGKAVLAAAVVVTAAAAATFAWAHGGDRGQIHSCVKSGELRIVDAGATCKANESALDWSIQGPQGLQGPQGPKGDTGAQGPAGAAAPQPHERAVAYVAIEGTKQGVFKGTGGNAEPWTDALRAVGFDYGVKSPRDLSSGQATGKRQHSPVVIRKPIDAATPQLFQALVTNEVLKSVLISFVAPDGHVAYTVKLVNASAVDIHQLDDGRKGGEAQEEVSFTFQKIEIESKDGKTMAVDDWSTQS